MYREKLNILNGKHFLLASQRSPPFINIKISNNGSALSYSGFCIEIIDALKSIYNFTYTLVEPSDGAFGTHLGNGNWTGIIGMVLNQGYDIGVGAFSFTHQRYQVVDYSVAFYEETKSILIPPPMEETRIFSCSRPFHWQVWAGLVVTVLLLPLILWLLPQVYQRNVRNPECRSTLCENYIFIFGVLTSQSGLGYRLTKHHATMIIALFWCVTTVVFNYAYVGTYVSFLSVPKLKPIISSLEDLPKSHLSWVVPFGTTLDSLFMEAKEGVNKAIGDGLRQHPEHLTRNAATIGPQKVLNGTSVYIDGKAYNEFVIEREFKKTGQCHLSLAKEEFFKGFKGFLYKKGSSLKPILDEKLLHMLESGLVEYWRERASPSIKQCIPLNHKYDGPRSLGLADIQSPFLIWGVGLILSLITFFLERCLLYKAKT